MQSAFYSSEIYLAAEKLADTLVKKNWLLGTAESCTGGGLGHALTAVSGSSNWYQGGIVSYSDSIKRVLLDVPSLLLSQYGAVSQHVATAMAQGAAGRLEVDAAIAITGIAGPSGGTTAKPVGLVWLGTQDPDRGLRSLQLNLSGSRDAVRRQAIELAINFFLEDL